ncbi:MAG: outer membrane protein assembly factor BamE [Moraxella sp.]|nr:outer membrane protein assembly factor BamE [Moraxella sp.]
MKKPLLNTAFLSVAILSMSILAGCQALRVHTIDLPQGTPITAERAKSLQIGMTPEQVLYVLGTPAMRDTLAPSRWDYIYDYTAGTDGKRAGKPNIKNASQYLSVHFDASGRVARIDGIDSLPAKAF